MTDVLRRLAVTDAAIQLVDAGALPRALKPFIHEARAGDAEALRIVAQELFTFVAQPLGGPVRRRFFAASNDGGKKTPTDEVIPGIVYIPPGTPQVIVDEIADLIINNDGEPLNIVIIPDITHIDIPEKPSIVDIEREEEIPEIPIPEREIDDDGRNRRPQPELPIDDLVPPWNKIYNSARPRKPDSEPPEKRIRRERVPEENPLTIDRVPRRQPLIIGPRAPKPPSKKKPGQKDGHRPLMIVPGQEAWKKIRSEGATRFAGFVDAPADNAPAESLQILMMMEGAETISISATPIVEGAGAVFIGTQPVSRPASASSSPRCR